MSNLNVLSENLILDDIVELSMIEGSENPNFPLSNITKNFTTKVFRSTESNSSILIDLKQNRPIDVVSIVGNNITNGFGVTEVDVTLSATSDFTGLTPYAVEISMVNNFGYIEIPETTARYIKIDLKNTGSFCELSNMFIGKQIKFEYNGLSQQGFSFGIRDNSSSTTNEYGQYFTNTRNQVKFLNGQVKFANKEEVDQLAEIISRHINTTPLWLLINHCDEIINDGRFRLSGYYSVDNSPSFASVGPGLFDVNLTFREIV